MLKKFVVVVLAGSLLVAGFGCSKKEETTNTPNAGQQTGQQPGASDSLTAAKPATPIKGEEVAEKVQKALDQKYPGDWTASGTTLSKGSYKENDNFKIVDEVATIYPGAMVSVFVGEERISSTIKENGKPVLKGYPTPPEVGETMKSGKVTVKEAGSMGSSSFQKVYLPLNSGDKTVAVMTISIPQ